MSSSATKTTDGGTALCSSSGPTTGQDDDIFMTKHHKQLLGENRNRLVENMFPDDILNLLVSSKVLSGREVTRIKEKGNIDAMNECLLDFLVRKPDRAFMEFVNALRSTDQGHVASLLVKRETPLRRRAEKPAPRRIHYDVDEDDEDDVRIQSGKHKAKGPTLGVRVDAASLTSDEEDDTDILAAPPTKRAAKASRDETLTETINTEILETSLVELRNLNRIVRAGMTPKTIRARKQILETLSELVKFRREIVGVEDGSVVFQIMCPTIEALDDLWCICTSGRLRDMFVEAYVGEELRSSVTVNVTVDEAEWRRCRQQLLPSDPPTMLPAEDFSVPTSVTLTDSHVERLQLKESGDLDASVAESPPESHSFPSHSSSGVSSSSLLSSDSDNSNPALKSCYSSFEELSPGGRIAAVTASPVVVYQRVENS